LKLIWVCDIFETIGNIEVRQNQAEETSRKEVQSLQTVSELAKARVH
jgi:hypothetical protein